MGFGRFCVHGAVRHARVARGCWWFPCLFVPPSLLFYSSMIVFCLSASQQSNDTRGRSGCGQGMVDWTDWPRHSRTGASCFSTAKGQRDCAWGWRPRMGRGGHLLVCRCASPATPAPLLLVATPTTPRPRPPSPRPTIFSPTPPTPGPVSLRPSMVHGTMRSVTL